MWASKRKLRVLDFDIETRPLSFWIDGNPTAEITAIASCWIDDRASMAVSLLGRETAEEMLAAFVERFHQADIVVGHYIRKFDLPMINGALMEYNMPQLTAKLTHDTKMDMNKKMGIPATQEYLGELLGIDLPKVQMSQYKWRKSNRLSPEGIAAAEKRAKGDVLQNIALRKEMMSRGLLKSPTMWYP